MQHSMASQFTCLLHPAICRPTAIEPTVASVGVPHGRALLALDDIGEVPYCYRTTKALGVPDFDWEAALGPSDKFVDVVHAVCPHNTAPYYCYGKDNKAYKKCINGRFPVGECKLEDQCITSTYGYFG